VSKTRARGAEGLTKVEIAVLGPVRVRVDSEDVTARLTESQRGLLAVLASAPEGVARHMLQQEVALAPSSVDPQLSRLRAALGRDEPVHRSRSPRPGHLALDRRSVHVDADEFLSLVDQAVEERAARRSDEALNILLAADDLWRGAPYEDLTLSTPGHDDAPVAASRRSLRRARRRARELAAQCWLELDRQPSMAARLERWADEEVDCDLCWLAATRAILEAAGPTAARDVLARWRTAAFDAHASNAHPRAVAERLVEITEGRSEGTVPIADQSRGDVLAVLRDLAGRAAARFDYESVIEVCTTALDHVPPEARSEILLQRSDAHRFRGYWDAAEADLVAAADAARAAGDVAGEAEATLAMGWISWDPDRFGGSLDRRLERLLGELGEEHSALRIRVEACLAGGTYQDGTVEPGYTERRARRALELLGDLENPLVSAQVLSNARKGLIDIDPPEVQLERARRIQVLGRGSAHHLCLGHIDAVVDLLLLDRVEDAREETERYGALVEQTGSRFHSFQLAGLDALWALHDGRLDDAEALTTRAEHLGAPLNSVTVHYVVAGQRVWHAYESGDATRLRVCLDPLDAFAAAGPSTPVWDLAGVYFRTVLGDVAQARDRFRTLAARTGQFRNLPRGPLRITVLAFAAMTAAALAAEGDETTEVGRSLLAELGAHHARGVLVGWPVFYLGSKRRFEGLAALAARDGPLAMEHLVAAADANRDPGPTRDHTLADLAVARALL
jgi:hypothetical protein